MFRWLLSTTVIVALATAAFFWLVGAQDGVARLYDLNSSSDTPLAELRGGHAGPITCVAFGPLGKWCVTGGEDRAICWWDTASGTLLQRFPGSQKSLNVGRANGASGHR